MSRSDVCEQVPKHLSKADSQQAACSLYKQSIARKGIVSFVIQERDTFSDMVRNMKSIVLE